MRYLHINGPWLRAQIALRGLTVEQFAEAADVDRHTLAGAIAGRRIEQLTVSKIIRALGIHEPASGAEGLIPGSSPAPRVRTDARRAAPRTRPAPVRPQGRSDDA